MIYTNTIAALNLILELFCKRLPYERKNQIDGFETEAEAKAWIDDKSAAWLRIYQGGLYAPARKSPLTAKR